MPLYIGRLLSACQHTAAFRSSGENRLAVPTPVHKTVQASWDLQNYATII